MAMRRWLLCAALLVALPQTAPAQAPGSGASRACAAARDAPARTACLRSALEGMTTALAAARGRAVEAIAAWDGNLTAADRQEWATRFGEVLDLWLALRESVCAPRLAGFERQLDPAAAEAAALECRLSVGAGILADLAHRFGGEGALARASFTERGRGPNRREVIAAEGTQPLCRHPGRGGDHQPLTACFERHAARLDRELAEAVGAAGAAIRTQGRLRLQERSEWAALAAAVQEGWRALRDRACALEAFETPNRFANSIHSGIVGPCLVVETEARIRWLRTRYRLR